MLTQSPIDTKILPTRRTLHFNTIPEAIAEADRLAAADRAGKLTQLGNWTSAALGKSPARRCAAASGRDRGVETMQY